MAQEVTARKGDAYVGIEIVRPDISGSGSFRWLVKTSDGHSVRTSDSKYVRASNA